jgi:hypothetical protein
MFKSAVDYPLMVKISLHISRKAMTKMIVPPNDIWTFLIEHGFGKRIARIIFYFIRKHKEMVLI